MRCTSLSVSTKTGQRSSCQFSVHFISIIFWSFWLQSVEEHSLKLGLVRLRERHRGRKQKRERKREGKAKSNLGRSHMIALQSSQQDNCSPSEKAKHPKDSRSSTPIVFGVGLNLVVSCQAFCQNKLTFYVGTKERVRRFLGMSNPIAFMLFFQLRPAPGTKKKKPLLATNSRSQDEHPSA